MQSLQSIQLQAAVSLEQKRVADGVAFIASDAHMDSLTLHVLRAESPEAATDLHEKVLLAMAAARHARRAGKAGRLPGPRGGANAELVSGLLSLARCSWPRP
jgi:hypothetical protein